MIAPATLTFPFFFPVATFPISDGLVDETDMLGTVDHLGGQQIVKYDETRTFVTHSLDVTNLRIVNGNQLWGDTAGRSRGRQPIWSTPPTRTTLRRAKDDYQVSVVNAVDSI